MLVKKLPKIHVHLAYFHVYLLKSKYKTILLFVQVQLSFHAKQTYPKK